MKKRSKSIGIYGRMPEKRGFFEKKERFFCFFKFFLFLKKRISYNKFNYRLENDFKKTTTQFAMI